MPSRLNQDIFIKRVKNNHSIQYYDYSLSVYNGSNKKVTVICPEHGVFEKRACDLMRGDGCPKCGVKNRKVTPTFSTEEFINESRKVHGVKYDYSKSNCQFKSDIVTIICPEHGEFQQSVSSHLKGHACSKCSNRLKGAYRKKTKECFIEQARKIHGDKYDYSKIEYKNGCDKLTIICPIHGEFQQKASDHLRSCGCPKCALEQRRNNNPKTWDCKQFVEKSRKIHGNKYDYSKVEYVNYNTKVCIICPEHGEFWKTPAKHVNGQGCPKCSLIKQAQRQTRTKEDLIDELITIYGDVYDYSKVNYVKMKTPICVICKKHGEFYVRPDHLRDGHGCPMCKESTMERVVRVFLTKHDVKHIPQYHNIKMLYKQSFDFYLPEHNIAIECQGEQHFISNFYQNYKTNDDLTPDEKLKYVQELDRKKKKICEDNGIELIYFIEKRFAKYMNENDVYFTDLDELHNHINK